MKTYKELKEGFFSKKKVVTAKELALKNNAPKLVDGNAQPDKQEKQIYHQKWAFVGDDYKGFDVERSKLRTKQYQKAVDKVKQLKNDPTVSKKIGYKSYWDKEIVPHIED